MMPACILYIFIYDVCMCVYLFRIQPVHLHTPYYHYSLPLRILVVNACGPDTRARKGLTLNICDRLPIRVAANSSVTGKVVMVPEHVWFDGPLDFANSKLIIHTGACVCVYDEKGH
jgi:hypothetical protein